MIPPIEAALELHFLTGQGTRYAVIGGTGTQTIFNRGPDDVSKSFIRAITSGDANRALDYVCIENGGGITLVFAIDVDWSDSLLYEEKL